MTTLCCGINKLHLGLNAEFGFTKVINYSLVGVNKLTHFGLLKYYNLPLCTTMSNRMHFILYMSQM